MADFWSVAPGLASLAIAMGAVWYARVQARASRAQVDAAEQQAVTAATQLQLAEHVRREQAEPYVVVDIVPSESSVGALILHIENIGTTVARDVRIKFDPPLTSSIDESRHDRLIADWHILRNGISVLPPKRAIRMFFDVTFSRFEGNFPDVYKVTVDALGPFGALGTVEYTIDLGMLDYEIESIVTTRDLVDQLKKINSSMQHVVKEIQRLSGPK